MGHAAPAADPWSGWSYLLGNWVGDGKGAPGSGTGGFSFTKDLQGTVIIRKSRTVFPAVNGRPAAVHEDLMVVYRENPAGATRADYYDSEVHVIRYTAALGPEPHTLVLTSEPVAGLPRYRLIYTQPNAGILDIKFEIAPPDTPEAFKTYLEGTAHRKPAPARTKGRKR